MADPAPGVLVISLDFELSWGSRGLPPRDSYRDNLRGAPRAVESILGAFRRSGVHATWATVGCLFCEDPETLARAAPRVRPRYRDASLSPYPYIASSQDLDPALHFAPELIDAIGRTPGQEVGSHSFSHYYCLEQGQSAETFRADLEAARRAAGARGLELRSFVFPKNQCNREYLPLLRESGLSSYRGPEPHWAYRASGRFRPVRRAFRLMDTYLNVSGSQVYSRGECGREAPANIRASRFLGPVRSRMALLEPLRLKRITRSLDRAASRGMIYHLWWHPHNFGVRLEENMAFLNGVLDHFGRLRDSGRMVSMNMGELAASLERESV